jgi:CRP-like cAMP-binding protein
MSIPMRSLGCNQILSGLNPHEYPHLFSNLVMVELRRGETLYEAGDLMRWSFFVLSGMVCLLATTADGATTQIGMIADEGVVGIPTILQREVAPCQIVVQIPGRALRVSAKLLREEFSKPGPLQNQLLRYVHAFICQISQSALCNRFHTVEQRLCSWLLISQDRTNSSRLDLTQETLSLALGATRTNVTKAAKSLKEIGLIQYRHGNIQIVDRPAMEKITCECYRVIAQEMCSLRGA